MFFKKKSCECEYHFEGFDTGCGFDFVRHVNAMSEKERSKKLQIGNGFAILDGKHFFVQGNIFLRVNDGEPDEAFAWTVWVKVTPESFNTIVEHWETPGREDIVPSQPGILCSAFIPSYPKTLNMEVGVYTIQLGQPLFIILTASDHPLSVEQRNGITRARREEIERLGSEFIKANQ